jgi:hypothetical protein
VADASMTVITMARAAATFGSTDSMKRPAEYKGLGSTKSLVKRGGDIVAVSRVFGSPSFIYSSRPCCFTRVADAFSRIRSK